MRTGRYDEEELDRQLDQRGLMNRFFGKLGRRVDKPWKMYPIGVLFGLGFDTRERGRAPRSVGDRSRERFAVLRDPVVADPLRRGDEHLRRDGRVLHELRLRMGVRPSDPQGLLQHHDHRTLGRGRFLHRDGRDPRPPPFRAQLEGRPVELVRGLQYQPSRLLHRRPVRADLGDRARGLAIRAHRGALGFGCSKRPCRVGRTPSRGTTDHNSMLRTRVDHSPRSGRVAPSPRGPSSVATSAAASSSS